MPLLLSSWGNYPFARQTGHPCQWQADVGPQWQRLIEAHGTTLPFGNGRSYGDSCQNPGGTLLQTRGLDRFIAFDAATGRLLCEAGVTLEEIVALVLPQGWFLPVTPGTRYATVGGAIANDVHGKNHHVDGSFGNHVLSLDLLTADGEVHTLAPGGTVILSGILASQRWKVLAAYNGARLSQVRTIWRNGWVTLHLRKD